MRNYNEENNIEENVNEFERNIIILNYHFSLINIFIQEGKIFKKFD